MCSPISFTLPCCPSQNEQTNCSLAARVALVVLGVIAVIVGALILYGMPGFERVSESVAYSLIGAGSLATILGLFFRCTGQKEVIGDDYIADPRVAPGVRPSHEGPSPIGNQVSTERKTYITLEQFLSSTEPFDQQLKEELKRNLKISDLPKRIKENLHVSVLNCAIPIHFQEGMRDHYLIGNILRILLITDGELLALTTEEISNYPDEMRNILSLRLARIKSPTTGFTKGSIGWFLNLEDGLLNDTIDLSLYLFCTLDQVAYILHNSMHIDSLTVSALLPCPNNLPFIAERSRKLLNTLPKDLVQKVLPFIEGNL
jgi:hypothetical protein